MGEKERRFQAVNSGAKHVVFIKCREPVEPCQLVHYMLSDMLSTKVHKSRCVKAGIYHNSGRPMGVYLTRFCLCRHCTMHCEDKLHSFHQPGEMSRKGGTGGGGGCHLKGGR